MWQGSRLSSRVVGVGTASPAASGSWVGRYTLGGGDELAVTLSGKQALVALGAGHADLQAVPLSTAGGRIRFQLPGRPAPVVFDGAIANGKLAGTVRQGTLRGTFSARPGSGAGLVARGLYRSGGTLEAVVDDPYGPARLVDLDSGKVRALYPRAPASRSAPGSRPAHRRREQPPSAPASARIAGSTAKRVPCRGSSRCASAAAPPPSPARSRSHPARASTPPSPSSTARARRSGPTSPISRRCCCGRASPCSSTTSGATASPAASTPARRRPPARSTPWRAMRRRPRASWPPSRRSIAPASGSRARARRAGSCPSLPHASRPSGSSSSSPARR